MGGAMGCARRRRPCEGRAGGGGGGGAGRGRPRAPLEEGVDVGCRAPCAIWVPPPLPGPTLTSSDLPVT